MRLKFYLAILALFSIQITQGQVVINEFSCANMDGLVDNYGDREDWIELYNTGSQSVNLEGYFLSDNIDNLDKWPFPAGVEIGPGEHLVIFASDRDEFDGFNIHAGFKLTQTRNEYIVFSDPIQNLIDAIQIENPNQQNHSTGRVSDGDPSWGIFQNATPGAPNNNAFSSYHDKVIFSEEAGFYSGSVTVGLTAETGVEIRYTLDGTEPTLTSDLYSNPITISETTVLKAKSFGSDPARLPSFTEANTYFIDEEHSIPVLSVAGDQLWDLLDGNQIEPRGSFEFLNPMDHSSTKRMASTTSMAMTPGHIRNEVLITSLVTN